MDYAAITDPSNTFATTGLSREVDALLRYLGDAAKALGMEFACTSTTDHPKTTASGNPSRHRAQGTGGEGLAIDCRLRRRGQAEDQHIAVFEAFARVETRLHELIYAYAPYNIRGGKRVAPYAVSGHLDHVHVSVDVGTFVAWPLAGPTQGQEAAMAGIKDVAGYCLLSGGDLAITTVQGHIYHFDKDGNPTDTVYVDAYSNHPELGFGTDPRLCIGCHAVDAEGRPDAGGVFIGPTGNRLRADAGPFVAQVFNDGSIYAWVRRP